MQASAPPFLPLISNHHRPLAIVHCHSIGALAHRVMISQRQGGIHFHFVIHLHLGGELGLGLQPDDVMVSKREEWAIRGLVMTDGRTQEGVFYRARCLE